MEARMTITPELKLAIEKADGEPIRIEDPEKKRTYFLVPEDDYRRLKEIGEIEIIDPSFYEYGEFLPQK